MTVRTDDTSGRRQARDAAGTPGVRHALVTGAAGMSGAAVVDALLDRGWRVTALTGRSAGRMAARPRAGEALTVLPADLATGTLPPMALEAVVHAAARSPGPGVGPDDLVRDNVLGTRHLITHARASGAATVIFYSSLSVYGRITESVVDETTPRINPDVYGTTKFLGEEMVAAMAGEHCRSLSLRLPGILGPGATRNWLSGVLASARAGRPIRLFNPAAPFNNAVHACDLARMVGRLVDDEAWTGHDAVTVGARGTGTVEGIVRLVVDATGGRSLLEIDPSPRPSFVVASNRASKLYGYNAMDIMAMVQHFVQENRD